LVFDHSYDAEIRLLGASGAAAAAFIYDGDGKRVASVISDTVTVFIGHYYEWTSSTTKKYRCNGKSRISVKTPSRQGRIPIPRVGGELGTVESEDGQAMIFGMTAAKGAHSHLV
jgi:hypothetical protein